MKNVSDKICREILNTHFVCNNFFFFENLAFYEIVWENIEERVSAQMTIWHMRIACYTPKATTTHSECVILISFILQQWLHECASMLRYTYIACLVRIYLWI